jgi:hypothetical protein
MALSPKTVTSNFRTLGTQAGIVNIKQYSAYSFRVAGVTEAYKAGVSLHHIKLHGNWKSNAVMRYICEDDDDRLAFSRAI